MIVYVTECWLNLNEHEPCTAHIEHRFSFAPNERKLDATVHKNYKTKSMQATQTQSYLYASNIIGESYLKWMTAYSA